VVGCSNRWADSCPGERHLNRAYETFLRREALKGKLGVFWHTQGSGKSFSMIFYTRKIFRKQTGNFTFVIVTDREDLDGQIYRNFLHTGTVTKAEAAQPKDSEEMRKFLGQNKRLIFTLIQKFRWDKGKDYPELSPRSDIIVIVDEAHRTQYKSLAENMRAGLKNAQFIAFTGTPLLGRDRKTNQWFGDYVSEYNFQQSMDDGATVPLFYEKRVPQVLIQNDNLSDEFAEIVEDERVSQRLIGSSARAHSAWAWTLKMFAWSSIGSIRPRLRTICKNLDGPAEMAKPLWQCCFMIEAMRVVMSVSYSLWPVGRSRAPDYRLTRPWPRRAIKPLKSIEWHVW
jgi:type I site-specific restriction-modification system R (restriction) subunit